MTATGIPARRRSVVPGPAEVVDARPTRLRFAVLALAVLLALALAVVTLVRELDTGTAVELPRLELPAVTSVPAATAQARLEELGFVVEVLYQPNESPNFPKGTVFAQRPPGRAKVPQGDVVTILVSDGPLGQQVPDVTGQQAADAAEFLVRNAIVPELVDVPDESVRPGQVVGTEPAPGGRVPSGATVRVLVSSGPAPRVVPPVLDLQLEPAMVELGRAGLAPGTITRVFRADLAPGTVFEVDPPPGTQLPRESPVSFKVAAAEALVRTPYLVGLLQSTATSVAGDAGLKVSVLTTPVPAGDPTSGRVVAQGVPPQAEVVEGTSVQITVAVAAVADPVPDPSTTTVPGG